MYNKLNKFNVIDVANVIKNKITQNRKITTKTKIKDVKISSKNFSES